MIYIIFYLLCIFSLLSPAIRYYKIKRSSHLRKRGKYMKKKADVYFLYLVIILYLITFFSAIAYTRLTTPPVGKPLKFDFNTLLYITLILFLYSFLVLPFVYALIMFYKIRKNEPVDLKRNSYLLLIFFIIDLPLHGFNIAAVIQTSYALKFIVLSLLINVLFFFKYKTLKINM